MSSQVVECRTAEEVRQLARRVAEKRREWRTPVVKEIPMQLAECEIVEMQPCTSYVIEEPDPAEQIINRPMRVCDIQKAVCKAWNIELIDLLSARRTNNVCLPRQIGMMLCRALTLRSYPDIGSKFGGRDHTTVLHAVRKFEWLLNALRSELDQQQPLSAWVRRAKQLYEEARDNGQPNDKT